MKIGIECEGRLRGVETLFINASELGLQVATDMSIRHVYISDHDNVLNYLEVARILSAFVVTIEVTKVRPEERLSNINLMLAMPTEYWDSVAALGPDDQVKFGSADRHVLCATKRCFVPTDPSEFDNDVELP